MRTADRPQAARSKSQYRCILAGRCAAMLLALVPPAAVVAAQTFSEDWRPELTPALHAYRIGELAEAERLAELLAGDTRDERVRIDARTLQAMVQLQSQTRDARLAGQTLLRRISEQSPEVLQRPEVLLALGQGRTALHETSAALEALEQAATLYAAADDSAGLAETYAALARLWCVYGEWELTPRHFDIPHPQTAEQARNTRRAQIAAVRTRAEQQAPAILPTIDLILGEFLLGDDATHNDGVALLGTLAARKPFDDNAAAAALALARFFEQRGQTADALPLHRRVAASELPGRSDEARKALERLQRPTLEADIPPVTPAGRPLEIVLRGRGLAEVQVEVRRVELAGWLEQQRGAFAAESLPVSGSLVFSRKLSAGGDALSSWSSEDDQPLAADVQPGAYVVSVVAQCADRPPLSLRRLALVSDLHAAAVVRGGRAAVWAWSSASGSAGAAAASPGVVDLADLEGTFWVAGSRLSRTLEFERGVASLALPTAALSAESGGWMCVVQAADHLALVHGRPPRLDAAREKIALTVSPPFARAGESIRVQGVLLGTRDPTTDEAVTIELRDAMNEVLASAQTASQPDGVVTAQLTLPPDQAGKTLSLIAQRGARAIENIYGRLAVVVASEDEAPVRVSARLPRWWSPEMTPPLVEITAEYTWGLPMESARGSFALRGARLPFGPNESERLVIGHPIGKRFPFDARGRARLPLPLADLRLPEGPAALGVWPRAAHGGERRVAGEPASVLRAPQAAHVWVDVLTPDPTIDRPVDFRVGFVNAGAAMAGIRPTLRIERDGQFLTELAVWKTADGFRCEPLYLGQAGSYQAIASVPLESGELLEATIPFDVTGGRGNEELSEFRAAVGPSISAGGAVVRLDGRIDAPLLVALCDESAVTARSLPGLNGPTEVALDLPAPPSPAASVVLIAGDAGRLRLLRQVQLEPRPADRLQIDLRPRTERATPGQGFTLDALTRRADGSTPPFQVLARLVPQGDGFESPAQPGAVRDPLFSRAPGAAVFVGANPGGAAAPEPALIIEDFPLLPLPIGEALLDSLTLDQTAAQTFAGIARLELTLPTRPGLFRLHAVVRSRDRTFETASMLIDTRDALNASVDLPATLRLGDRSTLSLLLEWPGPDAAPATVRVDADSGLDVGPASVASPPNLAGENTGEGLRLDLPAGRRVRIIAPLEAAAVGQAEVRIRIEVNGAVRELHTRSNVLPILAAASAPADAPAIRVTRSLHRLESRMPELVPGEVVRGAVRPEWIITPLEPAGRLRPGELVLVRELVESSEPLGGILWQQDAASTCITAKVDPADFPAIGTPEPPRISGWGWRLGELGPGRHRHEYVLSIVRAGTAHIPAPQVETDGRPVRIELVSEHGVLVAEGDR